MRMAIKVTTLNDKTKVDSFYKAAIKKGYHRLLITFDALADMQRLAQSYNLTARIVVDYSVYATMVAGEIECVVLDYSSIAVNANAFSDESLKRIKKDVADMRTL